MNRCSQIHNFKGPSDSQIKKIIYLHKICIFFCYNVFDVIFRKYLIKNYVHIPVLYYAKTMKNDGRLVLQINNPYYIEKGTFKHVIKSSKEPI